LRDRIAVLQNIISVAVSREILAMEKHDKESSSAAAKGNRKVFGGIAAGFLIATVGGYVAWTWNDQSTDDAQVEADVAPLAARTGGLVLKVLVTENSVVKAGDIIMQLDEADRAAMVKQAEAELATAKAQAVTAEAQARIIEANAKGGLQSAKASYMGSSIAVTNSTAQLAAARANLEHVKSALHQSEIDLKRAKSLREANAGTQERLDQAETAYDEARSSLTQAEAQLQAAEEMRKVAETHVAEARGHLDQSTPVDAQIASALAAVDLAHAGVAAAEAKLDTQRLQFSYLKVKAPMDGVVSKLTAHEGQLLQNGQAIAELVPTNTYVLANFKETQMEKMRPGQPVRVVVDTFGRRSFEGVVESLSGGTGSRFALLPPDNASGNFVKVVQRIPVRIAWRNLPADVQMRAGMSVDVTVDTGR
jgi:membrane fusion protein (multidrug efflux system)